jgi:hypothetical protein
MRRSATAAAILGAIALLIAPAILADQAYRPSPTFCANGGPSLCPILPAFIGADPALGTQPLAGYFGIRTPPSDADHDVQSPFDNMAWQMFVALNSRVGPAVAAGRASADSGERVWQTLPRVEQVFGPGPSVPACKNPAGLPTFTIASDGKGTPSAHNEEYLQASTDLPLIDVNGNWTIFERRLNATEVSYLGNPLGKAGASLTTLAGQQAFLADGGTVGFPEAAATPVGRNGALEVKAAWRILDPARGDDPRRYFTMRAMLEVSKDLVEGGAPICAPVTLGLVGMHIIQKNPPLGKLLAQWIWASFEHVDNAPLAQAACNPTGDGKPCASVDQPSCGAGAPDGTTRYSYFERTPEISLRTNVAPVPSATGTAFQWRPGQPYAGAYRDSPKGLSPQAVRCWSVYKLTDELNRDWQAKLRKEKSVFANYMLIGTQWGGNVEPVEHGQLPDNAVPGLLSNITLETYIQNLTKVVNNAGPGSCVGCHSGATLPHSNASSDFSFLPFLAEPLAARPVLRP